jgi:hypothetical protein
MEPIPRIRAMKARRLPTLPANGATPRWPTGSNPSKTHLVLTAPKPADTVQIPPDAIQEITNVLQLLASVRRCKTT